MASRVSAVGAAEVLRVGLVACCSGFGSAAGAYSYTTSFLGGSVGSSVGFSVGFSVGLSVGSLPSSESSSASLRVKHRPGQAGSPRQQARLRPQYRLLPAPAWRHRRRATAGFAGYPQHGQLLQGGILFAGASLITISLLVSV